MIYLFCIVGLITSVYVCCILWVIYGFAKSKYIKGKQVKHNGVPKISVIIPIRNEEANIVECLKSLECQNYSLDNYEVIIVDDNSTDNTGILAKEFISNSKVNYSFHVSVNTPSKKMALKYGIEKSSYIIIATTDGDCVLPKNWLANIALQFEKKTEMLLGPIMFKNKEGFLANFQILDMLALQGIGFGALYYKKPILNNAANLSYLKKNYDDVDGFDTFNTPSGDDIFLLQKFKKQKNTVKGLLSEDFIVETTSENTYKFLLNQRVRWASKSKYYSDGLLIFFSSIILIQNISMIFIYLAILLVEKYVIMLVILLFCKWLIDFILLFLVASFFKRKKALFYFIPVQIVYPIYIVIVWIMAMIGGFEWKGRKYNG